MSPRAAVASALALASALTGAACTAAPPHAAPRALVTVPGEVTALAGTGAAVAFGYDPGGGGAIGLVAADGAHALAIPVPGVTLGGRHTVAADGAHVYWVDLGDGSAGATPAIARAPLGGGAVERVVALPTGAVAIARGGGDVYVALAWSCAAPPCPVEPIVARAAAAGGPLLTVHQDAVDAAGAHVADLVADTDYAYWAEDYAVLRATLGDVGALSLGTVPGRALRVAAGGGYAYSANAYRVSRVPVVPGTGGAETVDDGALTVDDLWADDLGVAWVRGGALLGRPHAGGSIARLDAGGDPVVALGGDAGHLYYVTTPAAAGPLTSTIWAIDR